MTKEELRGLEAAIGRILRFGVAASAVLLTSGLVLWLSEADNAGAVLNAGLVVLMAVPIARILASFADALVRRDRLLGWATGIVLLVLGLTIAYSLRAA